MFSNKLPPAPPHAHAFSSINDDWDILFHLKSFFLIYKNKRMMNKSTFPTKALLCCLNLGHKDCGGIENEMGKVNRSPHTTTTTLIFLALSLVILSCTYNSSRSHIFPIIYMVLVCITNMIKYYHQLPSPWY